MQRLVDPDLLKRLGQDPLHQTSDEIPHHQDDEKAQQVGQKPQQTIQRPLKTARDMDRCDHQCSFNSQIKSQLVSDTSPNYRGDGQPRSASQVRQHIRPATGQSGYKVAQLLAWIQAGPVSHLRWRQAAGRGRL